MPTKQVWISGALPVAQVGTFVVTAYDSGTTYKITIGGVVVSVVGVTDAPGTATALKNALAASTHPYFTAITWTVNSATITATANVAGVPFVATSSVSGGTGTLAAYSATTAYSGPNDFNTAANWKSGAVPASGDSIVMTGSGDLLWGLDQSGSTFTEFRIDFSYTGSIGLYSLQFQTSDSAADPTVSEYRQAYLKCGMTLCNLFGGGGRIKLDFSSVQTTAAVYTTATSAIDGTSLQPVRLIGTNSSNELNVVGSSIVGVATEAPASEVATFATVTASGDGGTATLGRSSNATTPQIVLGSGCTLTTVECENASITNLGANVTTVNVYQGATYTVYESATHTTVNCFDGIVNYLSNGTLTTYVGSGVLDFSGDTRTKTVTNCTIYEGATLNANTGRPLSVTFSNGVLLKGCKISQVTIDLGTNITVTPS